MMKLEDDPELMRGALLISRSVAYLMQDLRELKAEYLKHKEDPTARREIAAWALAAVTKFVDVQSPAEENLALPFVDLVGALIAVGDGDLLPLLTPDRRTAGGRPHRPFTRRLFEVYPTAAIDILMAEPLKMRVEEAARFVISELNKHRIRIDGKQISASQLIEWRKRLQQDLSDSRESAGYRRFARPTRCYLDQKAAVSRMLHGLANDGFGLVDAPSVQKGE